MAINQRLWTKKEIEILKREYPIRLTDELMKKLKRSKYSIQRKTLNLGVKKKKEIIEKIREENLKLGRMPKNGDYQGASKLTKLGYILCKSHAKERRIEFKITFNEWKSFKGKNCYYCGAKLDRIRLDRINSKKSYTMDNVVVCCKICNWMKRDLSLKKFLAQCKKILLHVNATFKKNYEKRK